MINWKIICKKLLFVPCWLIVLLSILSSVLLAAVFIYGADTSPVAYATYVLSAYALTVVCAFFYKTLPVFFKKLKSKLYAHPYGKKYMTDIGYKVRVSLYISLGINLAYSLFKLISAMIYSSFLWGAIAVYYIILSVIRFLLLKYMRSGNDAHNMISEFKRYRLCGILMVILIFALTGVVLHMLIRNDAYIYPEVIIIASATYTFYTVIVSAIDLMKYRKYESPVISASTAIRLAAALVSLLALETSMLVKYGNDESFRTLMISLTGAGIFLVVFTMSMYMIIHATKEIKKLNSKITVPRRYTDGKE